MKKLRSRTDKARFYVVSGCPECDQPPKLLVDSKGDTPVYCLKCNWCGIETTEFASEKEAVDAWNSDETIYSPSGTPIQL